MVNYTVSDRFEKQENTSNVVISDLYLIKA